MKKSITLKPDSEHEVVKELYKAGFTEEQITALTKWIITILQFE